MKHPLPFRLHLLSLTLVGLSLGLSGAKAWASTLQEYCQEIRSLSGRKARIQSLLQSYRASRKLQVPNQFRTFKMDGGGMFNSGLCWWKSRFQRNMIYLARLNPGKRKPTREEALKIIQDVREMNRAVEIPGYKTVYDFTQDYKNDIVEALETWQLKNSVRGAMRTLNPLRPTFYRKSSTLFDQATIAKRMLEQYGSLPYLMLQLKGIAAHSWLVLQVDPIYKTIATEYNPPFIPKTKNILVGYRMFVEDPNDVLYYTEVFPGTNQVTAFYGVNDAAKSFNYIENNEPFPYYVDWLRDLDYLQEAIQKSCAPVPGPSLTLYPEHEHWGTYR